MAVVIIKNGDMPEIAEFVDDENGNRLVFSSFEEADAWMWKNAEPGVTYQCFDGE